MSRVYKQSLLKDRATEVTVLRVPRLADASRRLKNERVIKSGQDEIDRAQNIAKRVIEDAEETARKMLEQAKSEIERMREEAEEKSARRWQEMESKIEETLEQARLEGYQAGFESGRDEGMQTARNECEALIQTARETLELANEEKRQAILEAETFLVRLSAEIARKIVMETVEIHPDLALRVVQATLRRIKEREAVSIHAHPSDYPLLQKERKQLLSAIDERVEIKICPDYSVDRGGCVIRASQGSVDARLDTQLNEIKSQLLELAKADGHD